MSVTEKKIHQSSPQDPRCPHCGTILPPNAIFCGTCGERVDLALSGSGDEYEEDHADVGERYHITSFVRRRPYVQLFLAHDRVHQRPVAIREIDITCLSEEDQGHALAAVQQEYDLLRHQGIADVMPVIDLRSFRGHVFVVMGWPFVASEDEQPSPLHLYTLQDLLQSGIGLPDEAVAMAWVERLCRAVAHLHEQQIVLRDLDPYTIAVGRDDYSDVPALMVSWLPLPILDMLPPPPLSGNSTHFSAPEILAGIVDKRSDIYSLGALLYLLLTGIAPDEPLSHIQRPLRSPRDLNPHISRDVETIILRALAIEPTERFQSVSEMAEALRLVRAGKELPAMASRRGVPSSTQKKEHATEDAEDVTISIVPLRLRGARASMSGTPSTSQASGTMHAERTAEGNAVHAQAVDAVEQDDSNLAALHLENEEDAFSDTTPHDALFPGKAHDDVEQPFFKRFTKQITAVLPALSRFAQVKKPSQEDVNAPAGARTPVHDEEGGENASISAASTAAAPSSEETFLQRLQRFILGEQQHSTAAAALIETPLRVQPDQTYIMRIQVTGRDHPSSSRGGKKGEQLEGLSGLVRGELVHIEVRSALYQHYAYIVQRAAVQIPQRGYSAEVSIPLRPLAHGPSGRRERLHIFFLDEARRPLYEKPFVVEVFVSPLVQSGREGHNVLTIPL